MGELLVSGRVSPFKHGRHFGLFLHVRLAMDVNGWQFRIQFFYIDWGMTGTLNRLFLRREPGKLPSS